MLEKFKRKYRTLNTVQINAEALRCNFDLIKKLLPKQSICPVLKSNAYGHGLIEVASILDEENAEFFIVDSLYEAYKLKKNKIKTPILILGYTFPENLKKGLPFHFTAGDIETVRSLTKLKLPIHIEIDTGMTRMGFPMHELKEAFKEIKKMNAKVVGLFSHFADADNPKDQIYSKEQSKKFRRAIKLAKEAGLNPKWIHISNSAGIVKTEQNKDFPDVNMARVGYAIYGISPLAEEDKMKQKLSKLKPAMEVVSTIISIKKIKKGDKVGYGCTFEAEKDIKVGTIPFGYYEGLPTTLSNSHPILGRICMNHTMIDLTDSKLKVGDKYIVYSADKKSPTHFIKEQNS